MKANTENLRSFLHQTDLIHHAALRLAEDTTDHFAVSLLVRFEELDRLDTPETLTASEEALRQSLRRLAGKLLDAHNGGDRESLRHEIANVTALTSGPPRPTVQPVAVGGRKRKPLLVGAVAALVGAGIAAVVLVPRERSAHERLTAALEEIEDLEKRVGDLANEKAQAQDEREYATATAQEIAEIAALAAEINDDLELCIEYGNQAVDIAIDLGNGYTFNEREFDRFIDEWEYACSTARKKAADLRSFLAG